eukprot:gene8380-9279_t
MKRAIAAVEKKEMSLRKAVKAFGVPFESLRQRCKGELKQLETFQNKLGSKKTVLAERQEQDLAKYIVDMDNSFDGMSINDVRKVAFQFGEKNNIPHPFNKEQQMAGRDFVAGFLKRQSTISLRKPEAVSLNGVFGLNKRKRYFDNLQVILDKHQLEPHQIYNVDELGLTCVHKPVKVLSKEGKCVVSSATSGERGVITTVVTCYNAAGNYVPPMMIFKRKNKREDLNDHAPPGTLNEVSENGWIDSSTFMSYMKHLVKHVKPNKDNIVLLILDGHKTHAKNIELLEYAKENGVIMLSLPPHTFHKLQLLDRTFFKPLKAAFNNACTSWMRSHPASRITIDKLGELFSAAYAKAATVENAVNGFRCTGIVPFNQDVLPESDFLSDPRSDDTVEQAESEPQVTNEIEPSFTMLSQEPGPSTQSSLDPTSVSRDVRCEEIMKVPNIAERKKSKRSEESEILTSTPYKKRLLESDRTKRSKEGRKGKVSKSKDKLSKLQSSKGKEEEKKAKKIKESKKVEMADCQCLFCDGWWHNSQPGETWVQCTNCEKWLHEMCCNGSHEAGFICDFCD